MQCGTEETYSAMCSVPYRPLPYCQTSLKLNQPNAQYLLITHILLCFSFMFPCYTHHHQGEPVCPVLKTTFC